MMPWQREWLGKLEPRGPSALLSIRLAVTLAHVPGEGRVRGRGTGSGPGGERTEGATGIRLAHAPSWKEPSQASASAPCTEEETEAWQGGGDMLLRGWGGAPSQSSPLPRPEPSLPAPNPRPPLQATLKGKGPCRRHSRGEMVTILVPVLPLLKYFSLALLHLPSPH